MTSSPPASKPSMLPFRPRPPASPPKTANSIPITTPSPTSPPATATRSSAPSNPPISPNRPGQEVAALIDQLREGGVPAIFGSEVFPSPVVEQIGREVGVEFVSTLSDDDLPGDPGDPEHSYISMMVENLKTMAEVLGGDPALMDGLETGNVPGPDTSVNQ